MSGVRGKMRAYIGRNSVVKWDARASTMYGLVYICNENRSTI